MKKFIILIILYLSCMVNSFAQTGSINNTLGTGGSFIVKDVSENFLRVDQSTGNAIFLRNMELGNLDNSTLGAGVITKNNKRFLHNFAPNGSEFNNLFIGLEAGNFTMGGGSATYQSSYNVGVGPNSLSALTTGYSNTAVGSRSLFSNTQGFDNTAIGYCPLFKNTKGYYNTAIGNYALFENLDGSQNTATGYKSLNSNTSGYGNTAIGGSSLQNNTYGINNTAIGLRSLFSNSIGSFNIAIGDIAGSEITTGKNNISIGYDAQVPNNVGDDQVRIGNASITYAGIQVAWSITSDIRWKENTKPTNLGLDFITKLNPVSYTRKNDENHKIEYGLIAQELDKVLNDEGVTNAAMITIDGEGRYELRYNDLFAPIIKAIQDLKKEKDELQNKYEKMLSFNQNLAEKNELLTKEINSIKTWLSEEIEVQVKSVLSKNKKSEDESNKLTLGN